MRPPTLTEFLEIVRKTQDPDYAAPFFDDPGGSIALYRQFAAEMAYLAKRFNRAGSRQYFRAPVGEEPAGFGTRATMTATLERTQNLGLYILVEAGAMQIRGPRQRLYTNTETLAWYPGDPEPSKVMPFESTIIGEPGNAEWLGFGDNLDVFEPESVVRDTETGALDLSGGVVDTRNLDLDNQSDQRSGLGGTLAPGPGLLTELTDTGLAPVFRPGDVGLYLRINSASNLANVGRVLRIVGYSRSDVDVPSGSGLSPRTVILDDGLLPDLLLAAIQDDGGVFTDYTAAASNQSTPDDVQLLPATPAVNDAFYFGARSPFDQLQIDVTTRRIGDLTLAYEYWNGIAWVDSLAVDETDGFQLEGTNVVRPTTLVGWTNVVVNGIDAFWIRARVTAFVSQGQQPLAGFIAQLASARLQPEPNAGEVGWTVLDWRDLGFQITAQTAPANGRDNDLLLLVRERGLHPRDGETEQQLRRRAQRLPDVVTPVAIENQLNRILEPFGLGAEVCDPGNGGFVGLFWDLPASFAPELVAAWDLYEPGDAFPENPTFLPLDFDDSHFCFYVKVPPSGLGEFGAAWDEGPAPFYSNQFGTFLDSAWDFAFCDGYPWLTAKLLKQAYALVDEIKAGGTCFDIIEGDVHVCP